MSRDALFAHLLDDHRDLLWRVCCLYADTRPDQEDLFQDVLVQVWRSLSAFRAEAKVSTWLYRIALNTALSALRARSVRASPDVPLRVAAAPDPGPDPATQTAQRDAVARLYAALNQLSALDRALVAMMLDGCAHREIADVLGLSVSNVGVRLHRARRRLARLLDDTVPDATHPRT